jgi:hypothetical protein
MIKTQPTKHAPDVWESARFTGIFLASSFFHISSLFSPARVRRLRRPLSVCQHTYYFFHGLVVCYMLTSKEKNMEEATVFQTHSSDVLEKTKDGILTLTSKSSGCLPFFPATESRTIVINPNTKIATIKKRGVPFAEIDKIDCTCIHEQVSMEVWEYFIILKSGEKIIFCQLTIAAHDHTPQQISEIFNETLVQ